MVKMIPSPGISIPNPFKNGAAKPSVKENKNLSIQKVTAMGTMARRPAKIRLLIDCHIFDLDLFS
tara:strand:- start:2284 stop:2478 length:195 start_codon:yes stop_codon:yes gene_type:complete